MEDHVYRSRVPLACKVWHFAACVSFLFDLTVFGSVNQHSAITSTGMRESLMLFALHKDRKGI